MDDFRIIETGVAWSDAHQCWLRYNVCEELIDGRWEGFVAVQKVNVLPN